MTAATTIKPMLIVPALVEQPTWGGKYIVKYKNWQDRQEYENKKIGQSYELYGQSTLLADNGKTTLLSELVSRNPKAVLGGKIYERFGRMPLLIKFTQALGNSFQLHIKPNVKHFHWQSKPESWYFFETGFISCGIRPNIDLGDYKKICLAIDQKMRGLGQQIVTQKINVSEARLISKKLVGEFNPWQFVNVGRVEKETTIDLSAGGIHHSWEENRKINPDGNIIYEVQLDVADVNSTIRSFDQGKINKDGSIRSLNIDDYFQFVDCDFKRNDFSRLAKKPRNNQIFNTPYYCLDKIVVNKKMTDYTDRSFVHLFVKNGAVDIITQNGKVSLTRGHSCFLPESVIKYQVLNLQTVPSILLKTYVCIGG